MLKDHEIDINSSIESRISNQQVYVHFKFSNEVFDILKTLRDLEIEFHSENSLSIYSGETKFSFKLVKSTEDLNEVYCLESDSLKYLYSFIYRAISQQSSITSTRTVETKRKRNTVVINPSETTLPDYHHLIKTKSRSDTKRLKTDESTRTTTVRVSKRPAVVTRHKSEIFGKEDKWLAIRSVSSMSLFRVEQLKAFFNPIHLLNVFATAILTTPDNDDDDDDDNDNAANVNEKDDINSYDYYLEFESNVAAELAFDRDGEVLKYTKKRSLHYTDR
jgi:hypothetical protein